MSDSLTLVPQTKDVWEKSDLQMHCVKNLIQILEHFIIIFAKLNFDMVIKDQIISTILEKNDTNFDSLSHCMQQQLWRSNRRAW